jgi:hypothetical protein
MSGGGGGAARSPAPVQGRSVLADAGAVNLAAGDEQKAATSRSLGLAAALLSAWTASGSVGLMAHSLRGAIAWTLLAAAAVFLWPKSTRSLAAVFAWLGGLVVGCILLATGNRLVQVLAPAPLSAALALCPGASRTVRRQLAAVAAAIAVLGLFRFTYLSVPWFWMAADRIATAIGILGARLFAQRLSVGITFAGLDFLVPMLAIVAGLAIGSSHPQHRFQRTAIALACVVAAHVLYLGTLAWCPELLAALPVADPKNPAFWPDTIRMLVPWDVPALAALVHAAVLLILLRWIPWDENATAASAAATDARETGIPPASAIRWAVLLVAGAMLPAVTRWWPHTPSLTGKKIVAYEHGFLNWLKPSHGDYGKSAAGMYGLMSDFVTSLGAKFVRSDQLAESDLHDANVLIIIFPDKPWTPEQRDRIDKFVRNGGALIILGDHTTHYAPPDKPTEPVSDEVGDTPFNDLLKSTAMRVRFDSALFAVGGWLNSYEALAHPTNEGIDDDRNTFGVVTGASVKTDYPAYPLLLGRWGWNDPGDEGSGLAMMGNHRYDPGERLGDLVLVSEQPLGKGKIVVFGDTSSFTNNVTVGAHPYTARLLAYLADGPQSAHPGGRQSLAMLLAAAALAALLWPRSSGVGVLAFTAALAASTITCVTATSRAQDQFPTGNDPKIPPWVAYIDGSHSESASSESHRPEGLMGLIYTLERNGYIPLTLAEFDERRLEGASIFFSIGAGREFTESERKAIYGYVEHGGTFICTVGYDRVAASRGLLADFGLYVDEVPPSAARTYKPAAAAASTQPAATQPAGVTELPRTFVRGDPQPMGHFKSPYLRNGDYQAFVRFWAAWPICSDPPPPTAEELAAIVARHEHPSSQTIAMGRENHYAIILRRIGKGRVLLVGDTDFLTTKNMEREDGDLIEGARENADFWRWFLPYLRGEEETGWVPTGPPPAATQPAVDIFTLPPRPAPPATQPTTQGGN